jgi:predicted metal-dependent hydrolase
VPRTGHLHRLLVDAAREFNAGRYFEAHEIIEDGLEDVPDEFWNLFLGLIQISVGYHKVTQRRWDGAQRMLELGLDKVAAFPPHASGLNLEELRRSVRAHVGWLKQGRFDEEGFAREPPRLQPLPAP